MNPTWSFVLMATGIIGMWIAPRNPRTGWMINILNQLVWIVYAVATYQWGFLVSAFLYGATYIRFYLRSYDVTKNAEGAVTN